MARLAIERAVAGAVKVQGRELVLFAGCDYLGLAHAPEVRDALRSGLDRYGVSASGSRATTGNAVAHDELERDLARFLGLEAALLVPDGYLSNHVFLQGIVHARPHAIMDREAHVSMADALASSGLASRTYEFCSARSAREAAREAPNGPLVILTDGVYPVMRGIAPIRELLEVLPPHGWLVVDDCHGTGILGARGRGSHEHAGVADARLVVTGTLSKALGCFGGFVAGSRAVVDDVAARSRAFVGSTPIPPALAMAGSAAIAVLERDDSRLARLRGNLERVRDLLRRVGVDAHDLPLPVFAWKAPTPDHGDRAHRTLLDHGVLVPHVRYPDGLGSYFRLAVTAAHDEAAIAMLEKALPSALATR